MVEPPSTFVKYLGWIVAVFFYIAFLAVKLWRDKHPSSQNPQDANNIHGDYELMADVNDDDLEGKNEDNNQPKNNGEDILDKSVHKVLLKSTFSLCQELGD